MNSTFEEIHRVHPLALRCFATELQTSQIREFGTFATPSVSVGFAVRCSMSLPFLYTPVKDPNSNILYVDGGLLNNLPMVFLKEHEIYETWGVLFYSKSETKQIKAVEEMTDFFKYLYDGLTLMRSQLFIKQYKDRVLCIPILEAGGLDFEQTKEQRQKIIIQAEKASLKLLKDTHKVPKRRFSAA